SRAGMRIEIAVIESSEKPKPEKPRTIAARKIAPLEIKELPVDGELAGETLPHIHRPPDFRYFFDGRRSCDMRGRITSLGRRLGGVQVDEIFERRICVGAISVFSSGWRIYAVVVAALLGLN